MDRRWFKIGAGAGVGIVTILGLFQFMVSMYGFVIIDLTGDIICDGTYENPCLSEFTVRNPNPYVVDIYSSDQVKLDFSPDIEDYGLFVKDGRCGPSGACACELKNGEIFGFKGWRCVDFTNKTKPLEDRVYNFRFPAYTTKHFLLAGIKNDPSDKIKWGFGVEESYLDPVWLSANEVIYTQSSDKICNDGTCTLTLYSGIRNVYEDETWKRVENARSLKDKGFSIRYLENDKDFKLNIIDFNLTSITLDLSTIEKEYSKDIPIIIWKENETKQRELCQDIKTANNFELCSGEYFQNISDKVIEETERFDLLSVSSRKTYDFGLDSYLEFGYDSTTIELQEADVDNLKDAEVYDGAGWENANTASNKQYAPGVIVDAGLRIIYIEFNITSIPASSSILEANILFNGTYKIGTNFDAGVFHVYNGWINSSDDSNTVITNESQLTWNNQPCGTARDNETNCNLSFESSDTITGTGWYNFSVMRMLQLDIDSGKRNLTMRIQNTSLVSTNWYINFMSKEADGVTSRPILNVTYDAAPSVYGLNITDPTTASPKSVSAGEKIQLQFNFVENEVNLTTGLSINNITIGGIHSVVSGGGFQSYEILYDDFETGWETTTSGPDTTPDCSQIGSFNGCDHVSDDYRFAASSDTGNPDAIYEGSYGLVTTDWDAGGETEVNGIWYEFNPSIACDGSICEYIEVKFRGKTEAFESSDFCWVTERDTGGTPNTLVTLLDTDTSYDLRTNNLSEAFLSSTNVSVRIMCLSSANGDWGIFDNFNISGYGDVTELNYNSGFGWLVNVTTPSGLSGLQDLFINATSTGTAWNTETSAINYATNFCTPPGSGIWNLNCTTECRITESIDLDNNLVLTSDGDAMNTITLNATINFSNPPNQKIITNPLCRINIESGGKII